VEDPIDREQGSYLDRFMSAQAIIDRPEIRITRLLQEIFEALNNEIILLVIVDPVF
jgi:hypothetical protein